MFRGGRTDTANMRCTRGQTNRTVSGPAVFEPLEPRRLMAADTVYEDATDGTTAGWELYTGSATTAIVRNVLDADLGSRVIELAGNGTTDGHRLYRDDGSSWDNTAQRVLSWKMKTDGDYIFAVVVDTSDGIRYLNYTPTDTDRLGAGSTVSLGLGPDSALGTWQTFERDLQADLARAQPGATFLGVHSVTARGDLRLDDLLLRDAPENPNRAPVITPGTLWDRTTFSGSDTTRSDLKKNLNADTRIPVDLGRTYRISGGAQSGDGAGGAFDPENYQYFGFTSYDLDGNTISALMVLRSAGSAETTLARALQPGDTEVHLVDGTGWYNGGTEHQRSLAVYGHTDSAGNVYADYTYTRNIHRDAWEAGSVNGNVITLRTPWAGDAVAQGTAVGNAVSGGSYQYNVLSRANLAEDERDVGGIIRGVTRGGYDASTFRPGTAFITPRLLMNWQGDTGNRVTFSNVRVHQIGDVAVDEGNAVTLSAVARDADGDALTAAWTQIGGPTATLDDAASLEPTLTAPLILGGDATLTFRVDVSDGTETVSETLTVVIRNVNDPPAAEDDSSSLDEDGSRLIDVLGNDTDIDGDPLTIDTFTQGAHGTVARDGTGLRYTPTANFHGTDGFTYTVADGTGYTTTASVNVTIVSRPDAPVAGDDAFTLFEDTRLVARLDANDSDVDSSTRTYTVVAGPEHGQVEITADGVVTYTPDREYAGIDRIVYRVTDPDGETDTATATFEVRPVVDATDDDGDKPRIGRRPGSPLTDPVDDPGPDAPPAAAVRYVPPPATPLAVRGDGTPAFRITFTNATGATGLRAPAPASPTRPEVYLSEAERTDPERAGSAVPEARDSHAAPRAEVSADAAETDAERWVPVRPPAPPPPTGDDLADVDPDRGSLPWLPLLALPALRRRRRR